MREELTKKNQEVLDFIIKFITENGYSPSFREIGEGTGLHSTSSIYGQIQILRDLGCIDYKDSEPRTISVPGYKFIKKNDNSDQ